MKRALALLATVVACAPSRWIVHAPEPALAPAPASASAPAPAPAPALAPAPTLTVVAGGDIELGRAMGQRLLKEPALNPLASIASLLASGDVRFANLESPLSEQRGETMSPNNSLIFTGPPSGADALARAGITLVSTANNHAWDYGKRGLLETLENLDRVGVLHAGTGRAREDAYRPTVVVKNGVRLALIAVTDIFNHGPLATHEAAEYLARADGDSLRAQIAEAKKSADVVIVSYHGGDEYNDAPLARARTLLRAAIDAGADAVIGHHPHVVQGIEWHDGKPILYSLGNLLMQMHRDHEWTGYGMVARLRWTRGAPTTLEVCPYRIVGYTPTPFAGNAQRVVYESVFFAHLRDVDARASVAPPKIGATGADGCAPVTP